MVYFRMAMPGKFWSTLALGSANAFVDEFWTYPRRTTADEAAISMSIRQARRKARIAGTFCWIERVMGKVG